MRPLLDDPAMLEDDDPVGVSNRRQAVRDDEGRSAGEESAESALDPPLRSDVDARGGLVEDEDPGIG